MASGLITRRTFSTRIVALLPFLGIDRSVFAGSMQAASEVSHDAEAIHQEIAFAASAHRIYLALTDPKQFHQVVLLSDDGKAMAATVRTEISRVAGGTFALFGGHILGRNVEISCWFRPGAQQTGSRASIRSPGLNWTRKVHKPGWSLTTQVSRKARASIWLPAGMSIIGSRCANTWRILHRNTRADNQTPLTRLCRVSPADSPSAVPLCRKTRWQNPACSLPRR